MSEVFEQLKARANALKDERCHSFPNLICNEVPGFTLDDMCEPCQARLVMKFLKEKEESE
jgi:hypothetical protein